MVRGGSIKARLYYKLNIMQCYLKNLPLFAIFSFGSVLCVSVWFSSVQHRQHHHDVEDKSINSQTNNSTLHFVTRASQVQCGMKLCKKLREQKKSQKPNAQCKMNEHCKFCSTFRKKKPYGKIMAVHLIILFYVPERKRHDKAIPLFLYFRISISSLSKCHRCICFVRSIHRISSQQ